MFSSNLKQLTVSSLPKKKLTRYQMLQIANRNKKLDTILSQANASQNSRLTIDNTHSDFQPLVISSLRGLMISNK